MATSAGPLVSGDPEPGLRRSQELGFITLYGLGNILGAGIYVLAGKVAGAAGIYAPPALVIAAVVAVLIAFTFTVGLPRATPSVQARRSM